MKTTLLTICLGLVACLPLRAHYEPTRLERSGHGGEGALQPRELSSEEKAKLKRNAEKQKKAARAEAERRRMKAWADFEVHYLRSENLTRAVEFSKAIQLIALNAQGRFDESAMLYPRIPDRTLASELADTALAASHRNAMAYVEKELEKSESLWTKPLDRICDFDRRVKAAVARGDLAEIRRIYNARIGQLPIQMLDDVVSAYDNPLKSFLDTYLDVLDGIRKGDFAKHLEFSDILNVVWLVAPQYAIPTKLTWAGVRPSVDAATFQLYCEPKLKKQVKKMQSILAKARKENRESAKSNTAYRYVDFCERRYTRPVISSPSSIEKPSKGYEGLPGRPYRPSPRYRDLPGTPVRERSFSPSIGPGPEIPALG